MDLFAAQEHVLHDVQVLAQRQVLVHDLDAVVEASLGEWRVMGAARR